MCRPFVGLTACVLSGVNTLKFGSYFPFLHFQYAHSLAPHRDRVALACFCAARSSPSRRRLPFESGLLTVNMPPFPPPLSRACLATVLSTG